MSIDKYPSIDYVRQCVREEDGRCINLGRFDDINDARAARKAASRKYFGEFAQTAE